MRKANKILSIAIIIMSIVVMSVFAMAALAATYSATATEGVNVRTNPSSKATLMGKLKKGDKTEVIKTINKGETYKTTKADMKFYQLKTGGFVAAGYIKLGSAQTTTVPKPTPEPVAEPDIEPVVEDSNAVDIIGGDEPEILITDGDPSEIISETEEVIEVAPDETIKTGTAKKVKSTAAVHIRETPSKDSASIGVVSMGKTVTIVGTVLKGETFNDVEVIEDWYKVNNSGYIMSQYFTDVKITKETVKKVTTTSKVATAKSNTPMYSKPIDISTPKGTLAGGKQMSISSTISNGTNVQGTKAVGEWYKLSNGYYIKSSTVNIETKKTTVDQKVTSSNVTVDLKDGITATQSVRVRSKPSTTGTVMGLFVPGDFERVEEIIEANSTYDGTKVSGKWYKTSTGGFVSADYTKFSPEATIQMQEN